MHVVKEIDLAVIDEPRGRIRMEIDQDEVKSLADSIAQIGLLQPIIVRADGQRYEIIAGHRRFLAFRLLGRVRIPAMVRDLDDAATAVARATENLGRVDLSPIEEAATYADLRDNYGLSPDQIGKEMGKSPGVVKRRLDLLKMPPQLQKAVHLKKISYGVAEELWRLGDEGVIDYYLGYAVDHGVTVAVARQWVNDHRRSQSRIDNDVGGGGGAPMPLESKPIYLTCEICNGPTPLEDAKNITICKGCHMGILEGLKREQ